MSAIGTGYDLSASQYSPDGRIFQVEYAAKAVDNSGTIIALRGKDGVVIAVEKLIASKLFEKTSDPRLFAIDRHICCGVAGYLADANVLVEQSQKNAQEYRKEYGCQVPIKYLKDRVAMYVHAYTCSSAFRPFGCSLIFAAYDKQEGPQLYCVEPSGRALGYFSLALGKGKQAAKAEIEKVRLENMTCRELAKAAAKIIYIVHDEIKDKAFSLDMCWVGESTGGKFQFLPDDIYREAEQEARDALRQETSSDEEMVRG